MLLKEIYDRDIFRDINPAVVVSDKKEATVNAEISEYVFTNELIEKLLLILDTVLNKKSGKTGIWINGYYGSGKSHFIKYVHYLLNRATSEFAFAALEKAVENYDNMKPGANSDITVTKVRLLKNRVVASECDDIMFNVEDETDDADKNERLTRIFLNMFNKFRGYNPNNIPLALLLEKPLQAQGVLNAFKEKINSELGFYWDTDAAQVASFQLSDVLDIAKGLMPQLDIVALHSILTNPDSFKIGINATLIPELQSFLKDKPKEYRLLFLVDEVSQYIGSNKEILLNFQNIVERVSEDCNNQVWISCTAQQTLDEVSMGTDGLKDLQDEFGKILGRFDTRISLQSNDASYITQRRVLDKKSSGIKVLNEMYSANKDYIENQFKISHELYKGYQNEGEFIIGYPFVPYQFKLIAHVFDAFQQLNYVIKEVKDNERSVLGITHFTAKQHAEDEVGGFIPFDAFYNQQFHTNLTNRGAKAIQGAFELSYVTQSPFAQRVVKVLFMISNLLESQRQTFPSNIDNLTVLLMDKLDQNKKQLQKEIKEVLDKLIDESIVREENGSYFFFNEDEMDVQNLIKNQTIALDDRWSTFDDVFFRPLTKLSNKVPYGQNDFKVGYQIESKEIFRNGDFNVIVLLTDKTDTITKALNSNKKELIICINEWFNEDEGLRKDFDWYCRTNKYFINNGGSATGERSRTNENFRVRNRQLKERIERAIKHKFAETRYIIGQNVVSSDEIAGANPADRIKNAIEKHLEGIYKNHKLSERYAKNTAELKKSASEMQVMMPNLSAAEQLVDDFISSHNNQIMLHDLIQNFEKEPFGWRQEALIDILVHLVKKKKREFVYKGQHRYSIVDFVNKAVSSSEHRSCEVVSGEDIDKSVLENVLKAYKTIFNETLRPSTDGNEQYEFLLAALATKQVHFKNLENNYFPKYPFGVHFQKADQLLSGWLTIREPKKLFDTVINQQLPTKELMDTAKGVADFADKALKEYDSIKRFYEVNSLNFDELDETDKQKAYEIKDLLRSNDPSREFRHVRKAKDELEQALTTRVDAMKQTIANEYIAIFKELEKEADKRGVDLEAICSKLTILGEIDRSQSIGELRRLNSNKRDFKEIQLSKIISETPQNIGITNESETYYVSSKVSTISTEEELDDYLNNIRKDILALIHNKKTIILK